MICYVAFVMIQFNKIIIMLVFSDVTTLSLRVRWLDCWSRETYNCSKLSGFIELEFSAKVIKTYIFNFTVIK